MHKRKSQMTALKSTADEKVSLQHNHLFVFCLCRAMCVLPVLWIHLLCTCQNICKCIQPVRHFLQANSCPQKRICQPRMICTVGPVMWGTIMENFIYRTRTVMCTCACHSNLRTACPQVAHASVLIMSGTNKTVNCLSAHLNGKFATCFLVQ